MPKAVKVCRVCGKQYEACRTAKKNIGVFQWQDVACSPECGAEYLRRVNEARNPAPKVEKKVENTPKRKQRRTVKSDPAPAKAEAVEAVSDMPTE